MSNIQEKSLSFERYSSKTKRVNIPVPSFELLPKKNIIRKNSYSGYLIGRDRITEKLRSWLTDNKNDRGSYLITGYRGMGKTCFTNKVLYELTREANFWSNLAGWITLAVIVVYAVWVSSWVAYTPIIGGVLVFMLIRSWYRLKVFCKKITFRISAFRRYFKSTHKLDWKIVWNLKRKEWERINRFAYSGVLEEKSYMRLSVNVNFGQEILDEREILCVLASQLHNKYKQFVYSPIANAYMWLAYTFLALTPYLLHQCQGWTYYITSDVHEIRTMAFHATVGLGLPLALLIFLSSHQLGILRRLKVLRKRIDAALTHETGITSTHMNASLGLKKSYSYPVATTREIESQLIDILERISKYPKNPQFYFVFDELDKVEVLYKSDEALQPEYSNEKYLPGGGTSRRRKTTVLHILGNLKFFTTTAKAKFLFIAGREMYDAYLADLTDRESAISSLFTGVIYVESFCKNEKSEKDVMYNTETFIARQLIPISYIRKKVMDRYIECKLNKEIYTNIDINLKLYYEYLTLEYSDKFLNAGKTKGEGIEAPRIFNDARDAIDKAIILLYHFTVYLYHISNGSPKKMRMTFANYIRPIKKPDEFNLSKGKQKNPLETPDLDIHIPLKCRNLLSFGEKEQRVIGFIHYISFPVNQIFTDANQYGDKLLVSASFLINHIYKYHNGGFSWRNIEQTPELLEVYRIPEFRSFIDSILNFLLQTHIIQIPCGLYQYKFRKHISEEISLASKISEEVSAIFNFTLDESQTVKRHYMEIQKHHLASLNEEGMDSFQTVSGIHHIMGDLYMADEEYNNAILEYQTALKSLSGTNELPNEDPHKPSFMLAYIRCMLKLGAAYEKRRTLSSAYSTYNEIIDRLFKFREFKESEFGLQYKIEMTDSWPYHNAVLYADGSHVKQATDKDAPVQIEPDILSGDLPKKLEYKTIGDNMISDFSYLMTPEKHTVVQRLALLEDTRMVYQALLAKLFINEKIELGGITRANIDIVEGEYQYLHLATNEKEKFLISTDFFRRLGDIMYYKNGLIGFNFNHQEEKDNAEEKGITESFVDSLYYWAIDIKSEIHDFCRANKCFDKYGDILTEIRKWEPTITAKETEGLDWAMRLLGFNGLQERIYDLPLNDIKACNEWRLRQWRKNRNLPCYACKFYNRSLRMLMSQLFNIEIEKEKERYKSKSKTIVILREIVQGGSSRSMRKNFMVQFGELLDCLGNTMLSCADMSRDDIHGDFLSMFLHDVNRLNEELDKEKKAGDYKLITSGLKLSKLEISILYYWEASICFRYGNEQKKAAESIKKILRVFQNFLRVSERMDKGHADYVLRKVLIGEFLNEIKNRLVKQSLICLYSHYDCINLMEIQRLKWILYVQMYENISLDRLSLFPDVEEIMIIYYELIKLCVIPENVKNVVEYHKLADGYIEEVREFIRKHSREKTDGISFTWNCIDERNKDFSLRLSGIYNNISMGALSHHHTIYERVLSLRFKATLNQYILEQAFPEMQGIQGHDLACNKKYIEIFCDYFIKTPEQGMNYRTNGWEQFFRNLPLSHNNPGSKTGKMEHIQLLEFLIRDSIYCLTEILETITPYTSTTLFTKSFMGGVYMSLHKWNILFDSLFKFYKVLDGNNIQAHDREATRYECVFEEIDRGINFNCSICEGKSFKKSSSVNTDGNEKGAHAIYLEQEKYLERDKMPGESNIQKKWQSRCPYYHLACKYKENDLERARPDVDEVKKKTKSPQEWINHLFHCSNISDRFFESIISAIDKPNIHYTLSNYSMEMALKSYRATIEVHREGKAYKDMISKMYYLDDDLKNDTVQFDLAIERFKINNGYIDKCMEDLMKFETNSLYDVESFCADNESRLPLHKRFPDLHWNVYMPEGKKDK